MEAFGADGEVDDVGSVGGLPNPVVAPLVSLVASSVMGTFDKVGLAIGSQETKPGGCVPAANFLCAAFKSSLPLPNAPFICAMSSTFFRHCPT